MEMQNKSIEWKGGIPWSNKEYVKRQANHYKLNGRILTLTLKEEVPKFTNIIK